MRGAYIASVLLGIAALAACGEKPQTVGTAKKSDAQSFEGPTSAYSAAGWKAGDRVSWEAQMRSRAQNQDEYTRAK